MYTFLLVINSNFSPLAPFRRYGGLKFENRHFNLPFPHLTPPIWGTPQNFGMKLTLEKLEGWGYRTVKFHNPNFNRFCMIQPCDGLTEGQTDRQTDER